MIARKKQLCRKANHNTAEPFVTYNLPSGQSFPLNRCRRLAGDIVDHTVDLGDVLDDAVGDAVQQLVGESGPFCGDIVIGIDHPQSKGVPGCPVRAGDIHGQIIGQHHAHMIPKGLPGEGNILIYDNGGWAGYGVPDRMSKDGTKVDLRDYSRVVEINPVTLEVVWELKGRDLHRRYIPIPPYLPPWGSDL